MICLKIIFFIFVALEKAPVKHEPEKEAEKEEPKMEEAPQPEQPEQPKEETPVIEQQPVQELPSPITVTKEVEGMTVLVQETDKEVTMELDFTDTAGPKEPAPEAPRFTTRLEDITIPDGDRAVFKGKLNFNYTNQILTNPNKHYDFLLQLGTYS